MKIRRGFVSNSSSSSFILTIDEVPTDTEQVVALFFPGVDCIPCPYYEEYITVDDAAEALLSQLSDAKPLTREQLIDLFECRYDLYKQAEGKYPYNYGQGPEDSKTRERRRAYLTELATKAADEYLSLAENKGRPLYRVEFEDDYALGRIMEHGGSIPNSPVPSFRISHH